MIQISKPIKPQKPHNSNRLPRSGRRMNYTADTKRSGAELSVGREGSFKNLSITFFAALKKALHLIDKFIVQVLLSSTFFATLKKTLRFDDKRLSQGEVRKVGQGRIQIGPQYKVAS